MTARPSGVGLFGKLAVGIVLLGVGALGHFVPRALPGDLGRAAGTDSGIASASSSSSASATARRESAAEGSLSEERAAE
jgi:hypothetical protein